MFTIMSTIIPQSFTFFGIYLIFLNNFLKSAYQVFHVSDFGRPHRSTDHLIFLHWATESLSVDRSGRPKAPSVDRTGRPTMVQNYFFVFLLSVGRPTKFPVDRQYDRCFSNGYFLSCLLGLFLSFDLGFLAEVLEDINTLFDLSFQQAKKCFKQSF